MVPYARCNTTLEAVASSKRASRSATVRPPWRLPPLGRAAAGGAAGGGAPSARGGAPGFARARSASLNRCSWDTGSKTSDAASPEDPPGGGTDAASPEGPLAGPKVPLDDRPEDAVLRAAEDSPAVPLGDPPTTAARAVAKRASGCRRSSVTGGPCWAARDAAGRVAAAEEDDEDDEEADEEDGDADKEDEDDAAMGGAVTLVDEEDDVDADEEDDAEDADSAAQGGATVAMPLEDPPEGAAL